MRVHPTIKRLLKVIFAAFAGGVGYVTTWLASESVYALEVALIVAAITALAILAPASFLNALSPRNESLWLSQAECGDGADSGNGNPATGLPMMGGLAGLDAAGNPYGSNNDDSESNLG